MYRTSRGLRREAQGRRENITLILIMDPWSKVDYSRVIREASMAMEKLPEVDPPSGRVSGQGFLTAPILKRQWRRNREGIGKKGSAPRVFGARGKYRRRGAARGP